VEAEPTWGRGHSAAATRNGTVEVICKVRGPTLSLYEKSSRGGRGMKSELPPKVESSRGVEEGKRGGKKGMVIPA